MRARSRRKWGRPSGLQCAGLKPRPTFTLLLACGHVALLMGAAPAPEVRFTDVTQPSGVDFTHGNSATSNKHLVETMGGGVALLDYDNDGRLDVFFTNGAKIDDPMPPDKLPDKSNPSSGTASITRTRMARSPT